LFDITFVTALAASGAISYVFKGYSAHQLISSLPQPLRAAPRTGGIGLIQQLAILTGWHSTTASADYRGTGRLWCSCHFFSASGGRAAARR
jgi:hypothetical protein